MNRTQPKQTTLTTKSLKQNLEKQYINGQPMETLLNPKSIQKLFDNVSPKGFDFLQNFCYKVVLCPFGLNCQGCPRTGSTRNQYYEHELSCPFYHHDKDRRRPVLGDHNHSDFKYKASYKASKENPSENTVSQNWYESLFHPMFYKIYECKRQYCAKSAYCPFYHCEDEKARFEEFFGRIMPKQRVNYSKDKKNNSDQNSSEFIPLTEKRTQVLIETPMKLSNPDIYFEEKILERNYNIQAFVKSTSRKQSPETPISSKSTRKSSAESPEDTPSKPEIFNNAILSRTNSEESIKGEKISKKRINEEIFLGCLIDNVESTSVDIKKQNKEKSEFSVFNIYEKSDSLLSRCREWWQHNPISTF